MAIEPASDFTNYFLSGGMLNAISDAKYTSPTPVQHTALPLILAGLDLIVQSQTGTGKTAAFTIPVVEQLTSNKGKLEVLVLAPTRELAKQVGQEFEKFGTHKGIDVTTIYGGSSYERQYEALETAQVVTATPGRLRDLIDRGKIDLRHVKYFILDEADEMLSMGFQEEVDAIISRLPEERQSLLFSATITNEVRALGRKMLFYPEYISHSNENVATEDVRHSFFRVSGVGRVRDLVRILEFETPENAIIFANTKDDTFMVTSFLKRYGFRADALNGDLPQAARERTLAALKEGRIDFLVATDVAARGIDISDLSYVINFTIPDSPEVYVHRTGRTGRAGRKGTAISLVTAGELATLFAIKKLYDVPIQEERFPTSKEVVVRKQRQFVKGLIRDVSNAPPRSGHLGVAKALLSNPSDENAQLIAHLLGLAASTTPAKLSPPVVEEVEAKPVEEKREGRKPKNSEPKDDRSRPEKKAKNAGKARKEKRPERDEKSNDRKSDAKREDRSRKSRDRKSDDNKKGDRKSNERRDDKKKRDDRKGDGQKKPNRKKSNERRGKDSGRRGNRKPQHDDSDVEALMAPKPQQRRFSKVWVNAGKANFDSVDSIKEMVCVMAGVDDDDLGKITLEDSFSYIEVRRDYFFDIIKAMNKQEYNGLTLAAEPARK